MRFSVRSVVAYVASFSLFLLGLCFVPRTVQGADPNPSPSFLIMLNAPNDLLTDAHYLLDLTDATEQKQWPVLKGYLEIFLVGIDPALPAKIEVLFGGKQDRTVSSFPVSDLTNFRNNNLKPLGIDSHLIKPPSLYELGRARNAAFKGFMLDAKPYVHIAETQADIALVAADPLPQLKPLLDRKFAAAVEARNTATDAAAQAKRRELFQTTRKQTLAAIKKLKGETAADFDLRKKLSEIELDEAEWFFSESEHLVTGVVLDRAKGLGQVEIELTPIADSALAKAVAQLGAKPSYFANVEKGSDPVLYAKINHPLNEIRQKNGLAAVALLRERLKTQIDSDEKRSADEKAANKEILDKTTELIDAGIKAGIADGFLDVHAGAAGKNLMLGGFRTPDGTKVVDILNLVPKSAPGDTVKLDVAEESGAKIHSIEFSKDKHPHWNDFLGATTLYIGVSQDAIWVASGEGSLDALKAAIKKTTQPAAAGAEKSPWGELVVKLKPWAKEAAAMPVKKKGEDKFPKMALSALEQGDDQLSVRMDQKGGKVVGEIVLQKGLLRFAGKAIADFSRENLDETPQKSPKNAKN